GEAEDGEASVQRTTISPSTTSTSSQSGPRTCSSTFVTSSDTISSVASTASGDWPATASCAYKRASPGVLWLTQGSTKGLNTITAGLLSQRPGGVVGRRGWCPLAPFSASTQLLR